MRNERWGRDCGVELKEEDGRKGTALLPTKEVSFSSSTQFQA